VLFRSYRKKFDELPVKYQKMVRTVDVIVLVGVLGLLAYPYFMKTK